MNNTFTYSDLHSWQNSIFKCAKTVLIYIIYIRFCYYLQVQLNIIECLRSFTNRLLRARITNSQSKLDWPGQFSAFTRYSSSLISMYDRCVEYKNKLFCRDGK